jgi:hypothetical protein
MKPGEVVCNCSCCITQTYSRGAELCQGKWVSPRTRHEHQKRDRESRIRAEWEKQNPSDSSGEKQESNKSKRREEVDEDTQHQILEGTQSMLTLICELIRLLQTLNKQSRTYQKCACSLSFRYISVEGQAVPHQT